MHDDVISGLILGFKISLLLGAVFFSCYNMARVYLRKDIAVGNFVSQAIGITGFIVLQWLI